MSEEVKTKLFRNALNGYNKSDVSDYIEKMNAEFQSEKFRLQSAIVDTEKLIAEKEALEAKQKELLDQIEALKLQCAEAEKRSEMLELQSADKDQLIVAQNDALDKFCNEVEALKSKCTTEEGTAPESTEKARLYDAMSSQIGDILINANKNAEEILADASKKAESIISEANKRAAENEADAKEQAKKLSDSFLTQIKDSYVEYYAVQKTKVEFQKAKCEELLTLINADKQELDELAEKKHSELSKFIENNGSGN